MSKESIRKEMNFLLDVANTFSDMNGKPVKEVRGNLSRFLEELKGTEFERVDRDKMVTLRIGGMPDQLAEVVVIGSMDSKLFVEQDRLWKTIFGLQEQIQEMEAYEYEEMN